LAGWLAFEDMYVVETERSRAIREALEQANAEAEIDAELLDLNAKWAAEAGDLYQSSA
jgi:hypothetical protein